MRSITVVVGLFCKSNHLVSSDGENGGYFFLLVISKTIATIVLTLQLRIFRPTHYIKKIFYEKVHLYNNKLPATMTYIAAGKTLNSCDLQFYNSLVIN